MRLRYGRPLSARQPPSPSRRRVLRNLGLLPLAALATGCSPVALLNAAAPNDTYRRRGDIAYGTLPRQRLDLYLPADLATAAPVITFFYGGSWQWGSRADYLFVGEALAAQGFVAAVADYRVYPEATFPTFVEDSARALAWVRRHAGDFGGDDRRVFLMGHSAGAYNALMVAANERYLSDLGMSPLQVRGVIGIAGPYDFLPLTSNRLKAIFGPEEGLAQTQPINLVTGHEPPLLLLHGDQDVTVRPRNSQRLAARVRELGGRVDLIRYPDHGHRSIIAALAAPFRGHSTVLADLAAFVERESDA